MLSTLDLICEENTGAAEVEQSQGPQIHYVVSQTY